MMPRSMLKTQNREIERMASYVPRKGVSGMMDCLIIGTLAICFGLVWLLADWCQKQIDAQA